MVLDLLTFGLLCVFEGYFYASDMNWHELQINEMNAKLYSPRSIDVVLWSR